MCVFAVVDVDLPACRMLDDNFAPVDSEPGLCVLRLLAKQKIGETSVLDELVRETIYNHIVLHVICILLWKFEKYPSFLFTFKSSMTVFPFLLYFILVV